MTSSESSLDLAASAVERAMRSGADAADALLVEGALTEVEVRDGETESVERSESRELGLRVFVGHGQAVVSASRLKPEDIDELTVRAVAMAKAAPPDPFAGLADEADWATDQPDLSLADDADPGANDLFELAVSAEAEALSVQGVSKSSGASASASRRTIALINRFPMPHSV